LWRHRIGTLREDVHNGIEYGLMQGYAEGFEIMQASQHFSGLNLDKIAKLWNQGSVVRSWLLELTALALEAGSRPREFEALGGRFRRREMDRGGIVRNLGAGPGDCS
jgi:6-phosphogluconate dehydrogenase (decarboxylating)